MKIQIDGKEIEALEGESILDAALRAGIFIPHLCSHPDLEAKGGCRLCSVEIGGEEGAFPACKTKVREGMEVTVNGPVSSKVRKMAMELILATHPADCTGCPKYGKCELQSMYQYMGVSAERWRKKSRSVANDDSNPLISHLFTRCVRCGRCIRACQELRGVRVLDYIRTPAGIRAGVLEGKSLKDAGCRFCGACIEVCPTGSIQESLCGADLSGINVQNSRLKSVYSDRGSFWRRGRIYREGFEENQDADVGIWNRFYAAHMGSGSAVYWRQRGSGCPDLRRTVCGQRKPEEGRNEDRSGIPCRRRVGSDGDLDHGDAFMEPEFGIIFDVVCDGRACSPDR